MYEDIDVDEVDQESLRIDWGYVKPVVDTGLGIVRTVLLVITVVYMKSIADGLETASKVFDEVQNCIVSGKCTYNS